MRQVWMAVIVACLMLWGPAARADTATIRVDLRDAPRGLFHADLTFPAKPGPMTLVYPRWIPGDHLPAGPIENLTGLVFKAGGKVLRWRRDVFAMDAFHIDVPAGAEEVRAHLDFLAVPSLVTAINHAENATSENIAILRWHVVTLYPEGETAATYPIRPSVILPPGWHFASALRTTPSPAGVLSFAAMPLARLIDSPLVAGSMLKRYSLAPQTKVPHAITVVADNPADLAMTESQKRALASTVDQAIALFRSVPFPHYDFLVTLSSKIHPRVPIGGQEHHESSDNIGGGGLFRDAVGRRSIGETLAHEYAHVWSGKYRRPVGETTKTYQEPNDNSLLWVYEGLTSYLGKVLAVRSDAWTQQEFRDALANDAADMTTREGRQWRSLADTAIGLQALMRARGGWSDWRRSVDYYPEGALLWLDIDVEIRRRSGGKRSLDDFCRLFFAKTAHDPLVKPYDLPELVATLNAIAPSDWTQFLSARLDEVGTTLPTDVLERAGWTLAYDRIANPFMRADESGGAVNSAYSAGLSIGGDGEIQDVRRGSAAYAANLGPGMRILSVNGVKYSGDAFRQALDAKTPIVLLVANGDAVHQATIAYRGGPQYPMLARRAGMPDLLAAIAAPLPVDVAR